MVVVKKRAESPPVEPRKRMGKHKRHDQDACPEDERVLDLAKIKAAHTTYKQVADSKVEEAP